MSVFSYYKNIDMDAPQTDEHDIVPFICNDVERIIKESIEATLGGKTYHPELVNYWIGLAVETCLIGLIMEQKPYKYICNCTIMEKTGAGIHTATLCYWNNSTDGSCTIRWENDTMYCIFSVFGVAV